MIGITKENGAMEGKHGAITLIGIGRVSEGFSEGVPFKFRPEIV